VVGGAPIWMTLKQALEFEAHVRKGEPGALSFYADKITRTETDTTSGEEAARAIPFVKGYTVFNVELIDGLPERLNAKPGAERRASDEFLLAATAQNLWRLARLRPMNSFRKSCSRNACKGS
jgi:antirestriction protein ArdC